MLQIQEGRPKQDGPKYNTKGMIKLHHYKRDYQTPLSLKHAPYEKVIRMRICK